MSWQNAEFHIEKQRGIATGVTVVRSVLAHFMRSEREAACGWKPNASTRLQPEDFDAPGAFRCPGCQERLR